MCPLTLHASAAAETIGHRRVIHIEYAADDLPAGLEWNGRILHELSPQKIPVAAEPLAARQQ
jgi:hypothetical protein